MTFEDYRGSWQHCDNLPCTRAIRTCRSCARALGFDPTGCVAARIGCAEACTSLGHLPCAYTACIGCACARAFGLHAANAKADCIGCSCARAAFSHSARAAAACIRRACTCAADSPAANLSGAVAHCICCARTRATFGNGANAVARRAGRTCARPLGNNLSAARTACICCACARTALGDRACACTRRIRRARARSTDGPTSNLPGTAAGCANSTSPSACDTHCAHASVACIGRACPDTRYGTDRRTKKLTLEQPPRRVCAPPLTWANTETGCRIAQVSHALI